MRALLLREYKEGLAPVVAAVKAEVEKIEAKETTMEEIVGHCKIIKKLYFVGGGLIKVGSATSTIGSAVSRLLVSAQCERKNGTAPAGNMERIPSKYLAEKSK